MCATCRNHNAVGIGLSVQRVLTGPLLAIALTALAAAGAFADERVEFTGTHTDQQFVAGNEVRVTATVKDDLFVAGGDVRITGSDAHDLIVTGGEVEISDTAAEDLILAGGSMRLRDLRLNDAFVAGGELDFEGMVADDVFVAGGRVRFRPETSVGGNAVLAAGEIELEGQVKGNLRAAAARIVISGQISGDVDLAARDIVLAPGARIDGKLSYRSRSKPEIAAGASVAGGIERVGRGPGEAQLRGLIIAAYLTYGLMVVGVMILAALLQAAIPNILRVAAETIGEQPFTSLGLGISLAVGLPVVATILTVTVIGMPLGVFAFLLFAILLVPAGVTSSFWLGLKIRGLFRFASEDLSAWARVGWTIAGLLLIAIFGALPLLGGLVLAIALLLGLGAFGMQVWFWLRSERPEAVPW